MGPTRTSTAPLFRRGAEDLVTRLEGDSAPAARALCGEARALLAVFAGWEKERPTDDARVARIEQLFDLNKRVLAYLGSHPQPSAPPPSRRFGH